MILDGRRDVGRGVRGGGGRYNGEAKVTKLVQPLAISSNTKSPNRQNSSILLLTKSIHRLLSPPFLLSMVTCPLFSILLVFVHYSA